MNRRESERQRDQRDQEALDRLWRELSEFVGARRRLTRIEKLVLAQAHLYAGAEGIERARLDASIMCMHVPKLRGPAPVIVSETLH
ncbi:MAG: hypothetical protein KIT84_26505 [Labilithrix sp.]|nr:hypothetical protein [Labilithrix sp.]MCW5814605.1 hypothetical protein [Labilithrix sp.]